jgi:hypothetical protein
MLDLTVERELHFRLIFKPLTLSLQSGFKNGDIVGKLLVYGIAVGRSEAGAESRVNSVRVCDGLPRYVPIFGRTVVWVLGNEDTKSLEQSILASKS